MENIQLGFGVTWSQIIMHHRICVAVEKCFVADSSIVWHLYGKFHSEKISDESVVKASTPERFLLWYRCWLSIL